MLHTGQSADRGTVQDVNAENEQRNTPLHYACLLGHTEARAGISAAVVTKALF